MASSNKLRLARRKRGAETTGNDTPGISPTDIAAHNSRAALELLRRSGPQTRLELSDQLQLTQPAIAGIMTRLLDAGHVFQRKRAGVGRYVSSEYVLKADSAYAVGIKWAATAGGKACLIDLSGAVVAIEEFGHLPDAGLAVDRLLHAGDRRLRCRGIAVALSADLSAEAVPTLSLPDGMPVRTIEETEAAVIAEHVVGIGELDGGIVVILIGPSVRAGLLFDGKPFRGEHGRAGNIGAMRTGNDRIRLDQVLGIGSQPAFLRHAAERSSELFEGWTEMAARHLKDVVVAMGGFLSPGLILIGGDLPTDALDAIIAKVNRQTRAFIASFSVPELVRTSFADGGTAEGAAVTVFLGDLLPDLKGTERGERAA